MALFQSFRDSLPPLATNSFGVHQSPRLSRVEGGILDRSERGVEEEDNTEEVLTEEVTEELRHVS